MKFKDKYSTETEVDKIKITPEAFAIGEMIQVLIDKIERVRVSLK